MTARDRFDDVVASWLLESGPADIRPKVVDEALATAARRPQFTGLRGWLTGPAPWPARGRLSLRRLSPTARMVALAALLTLAVGAAVGAALLLRSPEVPALRGVFESAGALPGPATLGVLQPDGKVLIFGGAAASQNGIGSMQVAPEPIFLYDPATGTSVQVGSTASSVSCVVALADGRVLAIELAPSPPGGGSAGASAAELVDPDTGAVVSLGSTGGRNLFGACVRLADGRVLLVGDAAGTTEATIFDPATNDFSATGSTITSMMQPTATLLADGRVLVVGEREAMAELYDPATGTFSQTGAMAGPHEDFTATRLLDGRVLIAGGWATNGTVVDGNFFPSEPARLGTEAELYDPTTGRFGQVGPMMPRVYHFAVALKDGHVLIGGGSASTRSDVGSGGIVDPIAPTAELFDPVTNTFNATGALAIPRFGAGAVLLDDGTVLVVGSTLPIGSQGNAYPDGSSVEIYR